MAKSQQKFNIYQHVTDTILAELEAGTVPWRKPWSGGGGLSMPVRATGESYRGINVLMLWCAAQMRGAISPMWMTYCQAQKLGGQVRKGDKSATVVKFGKMLKDGEIDPVTGAAGDDRRIPYARAYRVFNVEQIDGLDAGCYQQPEPPRVFDILNQDGMTDPVLDNWFASLGVQIVHSPEPEAYYAPARDRIHMPLAHTFESLHRYFHTLAHEHAHATKHSSRLDRHHSGKTKVQRYAQEEIVAEISSAMVSARLGITPAFEENAAYLQHWIDILKSDHRAIVKAASMAQAAADWMFETAGTPDRAQYGVSDPASLSGGMTEPGQGVPTGAEAA